MKKIIITLIIFIGLVSCKNEAKPLEQNNPIELETVLDSINEQAHGIETNTEPYKHVSKPTDIGISFMQNGEVVMPVNGVLTLNKSEFDVVLNSKTGIDVFVNVSKNNTIYTTALQTNPLTESEMFQYRSTIAEHLFNPDKDIFVSDEGTSIWFYEDDEHHKFNNVEVKDNQFVFTRTIQSFNDIDIKEITSINTVNIPIYLVFVVLKMKDQKVDLEEQQRLAVKIEWIDNDYHSEDMNYEERRTYFDKLLRNISPEILPVIDTTSFDTDRKYHFYTNQELKFINIEQIYPNYFAEGNNYKTAPSYSVILKDDYNSLVLTTFKGENEMESVLVNYDYKGHILDHIVVSYDEIAEGLSRTHAEIGHKKIKVFNTFFGDEIKRDSTAYIFKSIGEFGKIATEHSSSLKGNKMVKLNTIYTDTIQFEGYNNDYDYFILLGKKNGKDMSLVYNWEESKYNFTKGDTIKVTWEMKGLNIVGDEDLIEFIEYALEAEKID
jgi:hypothetical protein